MTQVSRPSLEICEQVTRFVPQGQPDPLGAGNMFCAPWDSQTHWEQVTRFVPPGTARPTQRRRVVSNRGCG